MSSPAHDSSSVDSSKLYEAFITLTLQFQQLTLRSIDFVTLWKVVIHLGNRVDELEKFNKELADRLTAIEQQQQQRQQRGWRAALPMLPRRRRKMPPRLSSTISTVTSL